MLGPGGPEAPRQIRSHISSVTESSRCESSSQTSLEKNLKGDERPPSLGELRRGAREGGGRHHEGDGLDKGSPTPRRPRPERDTGAERGGAP